MSVTFIKLNKPQTEAIGIDVGIAVLVQCSNGKKIDFTDKEKAYINRLKKRIHQCEKRHGKRYGKRAPGDDRPKSDPKTKKSRKLQLKKLKTYRKLVNIRRNKAFHIANELIKQNPESVVIEDLNIRGMIKNKGRGKSVKESGWRRIMDAIEFKGLQNEVEVIKVGMFYPSTKRCSNCGHKKSEEDWMLKVKRIYVCDKCGYTIDRDLNAAINMKQWFYDINVEQYKKSK